MIKSTTKTFLIFSLIAFSILFTKCNEVDEKGGVAFTFDDQYITEWVEYADLFDKYGIKATFYVSRPQLLDSLQIVGLNELKKRGHEIACHGLNHKNALDFSDSIESYYLQEIKPAIDIFDSLGFKCSSFAYPFGNSTTEMDCLLLNYFDNVRKATWNTDDTTLNYYDDIYATQQDHRIVNSMGLDFNYKISLQSVASGIDRAKEEDEILIFHDHKIDSSNNNYSVSPEYLESVFMLCKEKGVRTFRMSELKNYFKSLE